MSIMKWLAQQAAPLPETSANVILDGCASERESIKSRSNRPRRFPFKEKPRVPGGVALAWKTAPGSLAGECD